jgi:hypothetical protein
MVNADWHDSWREARGCNKVVDASIRWHDVEGAGAGAVGWGVLGGWRWLDGDLSVVVAVLAEFGEAAEAGG